MADAKGTLTPEQFEILQVLWDSGNDGATVAEIWNRISQRRTVGRTTILKQVQRLEERDWVSRLTGDKVARYLATEDREKASGRLVGEFVEDFFAGSVDDLVLSLLGTRSLSREEVRRLRQIIDEHATNRNSGRER